MEDSKFSNLYKRGWYETSKRLIILGLTATTIAYLGYFLSKQSSKFKSVIDSIMNPTFVKYLQDNKWLVISLIAILAISAIYKLIAVFRGNEKFQYNLQYRIIQTNCNYNKRDNFNIPKILHCTIGEIETIEDTLGDRAIYNVASLTEFSIKKLLIATAISVCITSLVGCYTGKSTFLPFNVVPEFIQNSKVLLGLATAVVGLVAIFFVYNLVMDICNMIGVTYDKDALFKFYHDDDDDSKEVVLVEYNQNSKSKPRKLVKEEPYNRHLEDVICDNVLKAGKFVVDKISGCFSGYRGGVLIQMLHIHQNKR